MLLTALALAYTGACAALFVFQDALIYFPQPRALATPQSTLVLPVDDATLVLTVRPLPGAQAIVYLGGNAEDVSHNLPALAQAFPQHALYLLHYRGYGGSSGTPGEAANTRDALALFDHVQARHAEVAVIGRSLGSGVAVRLASQRPVARLVLVTPYDSLEEIAASRFPYFPVRWLLRDKYRSGSYAPAVTAPTRLLVAQHDEIIPRASSDALLGRFRPGVASLRVIAQTDHNGISAAPGYLGELQAALAAGPTRLAP